MKKVLCQQCQKKNAFNPIPDLDRQNAVIRITVLLDRIDSAAEQVSLSLDHWTRICSILLPEIYPTLASKTAKYTQPGSPSDLAIQRSRVKAGEPLCHPDDQPATPGDPEHPYPELHETRGKMPKLPNPGSDGIGEDDPNSYGFAPQNY